MKFVYFLSFYLLSTGLVYAQNISFKSFRDYLASASRLDSLKKVERSMVQNSQSSQYLHLLIAIELGKSFRGA
ncbi:MAG TPA: hypothetical protein DCM71_24635 [Runella sp.]|nr:hypothetical protein [Runella sp.]